MDQFEKIVQSRICPYILHTSTCIEENQRIGNLALVIQTSKPTNNWDGSGVYEGKYKALIYACPYCCRVATFYCTSHGTAHPRGLARKLQVDMTSKL